MRLLLDTPIYLWWLANSPRLSPAAANLISAADHVYVSSASFWELSIKTALGKLNVNLEELIDQLAVNQFFPCLWQRDMSYACHHCPICIKIHSTACSSPRQKPSGFAC